VHCKLAQAAADRFVAFTCPEHHAAGDLEHFKKSWDALAEESWQEGYGFQVAEVTAI